MHQFVQREAWSQAMGVLLGLNAFWVNRPDAIWRANHKLLQLRIASGLNLRIPQTLSTRDPSEARDFIARVRGSVVVKAVSYGLLDHPQGEQVVYTNRVDRSIADQALDAVRYCPILLQEEIRKRRDIRITIVGNYQLAVAIDSQVHDDTIVDWRRPTPTPLRHTIVELDQDLLAALRVLCRRLDLSYAAIDLIEDSEGNYVFLEVNPNGQWGWLQIETGAPIADAIIDCLEGEGRGRV